jgi:hypothetical protein
MKKFVISLAALAAFSTAAAAASYGDNTRGDDDQLFDSSAEPAIDEAGFAMPNSDAVAIAEVGDGWLFANGENVKDPMEVRRFDEKN